MGLPAAIDAGTIYQITISYDGSACANGSGVVCTYRITYNNASYYYNPYPPCESGPASVALPVEFLPAAFPVRATATLDAQVLTADPNGCITKSLVTSTNASLEVYPALSATIAANSAERVDLGQTLDMIAMVGGGFGAYVETWSGLAAPRTNTLGGTVSAGLPPNCLGVTQLELSCPTDVAGNWSLTFNLSDSNNATVSLTDLLVLVAPDLQVAGAWMVEPDQVGEPLYLHVAVAGGVPGGNMSWSGLPPGCVTANPSDLATVNCIPNASGIYHPVFHASDGAGQSVTHTFRINVPALSGAALNRELSLTVAAITGVVAVVAIFVWISQRRRGPNGGGGEPLRPDH